VTSVVVRLSLDLNGKMVFASCVVFSLDLSYFSFVAHFPLMRSYSLDLGSFLLGESLVRTS
jgi:hypothetical protein